MVDESAYRACELLAKVLKLLYNKLMDNKERISQGGGENTEWDFSGVKFDPEAAERLTKEIEKNSDNRSEAVEKLEKGAAREASEDYDKILATEGRLEKASSKEKEELMKERLDFVLKNAKRRPAMEKELAELGKIAEARMAEAA